MSFLCQTWGLDLRSLTDFLKVCNVSVDKRVCVCVLWCVWYIYMCYLFSRVLVLGGKVCQWEYVHGLLENAIYGGRIDHTCDLRVLRSYLQQFFNAQLLAQSLTHSRMKKTHAFPAQIHLPNSCSIAVRDSITHGQFRSTLYRVHTNITHNPWCHRRFHDILVFFFF